MLWDTSVSQQSIIRVSSNEAKYPAIKYPVVGLAELLLGNKAL